MHKSVGYFRRKKILRHANFLDLTPMVLHRHELESDDTVKVLAPRFTGRPLGVWLQKRARHPHTFSSLDELGSATWLLCNGDHSVRQICQALKGSFGRSTSPSDEKH